MTWIELATRDEQKKLREDCLKRDGQRCVVTGLVNRAEFMAMPESSRVGLLADDVDCAHILPFALRKFDENDAQEVSWSVTLTVIYG
jgi:hypothetical protein